MFDWWQLPEHIWAYFLIISIKHTGFVGWEARVGVAFLSVEHHWAWDKSLNACILRNWHKTPSLLALMSQQTVIFGHQHQSSWHIWTLQRSVTPPTNPKTSHIARGWKKHPAHGTILVALLEDMQHTSLKMRCQCLPLSVVSFLNPICHSGVFYLIEIHVYQNSKTPECVKSFLTFTDHLFLHVECGSIG